MTDEYANQPSIEEWRFIEQLKSPLHAESVWKRLKGKGCEADLRDGVFLEFEFPDKLGKLYTAYDDFRKFLSAGDIRTDGKYKIVTGDIPTSCFEEYMIDVDENSCRLLANDTEGIRRALVFLEDRITSSGGPFIKLGHIKRTPFIKTRISRCFFGPIKRLPLNRDELMDEIDYYPDEYLNRLVHEGINALWLSVEFRDLCPSKLFPGHGSDCQRRFEKLRRTINQCGRYGIKIYIYCNEPVGFGDEYYLLPSSSLDGHPGLAGHKEDSGWFNCTYFCTSSKEGLEYVEECARFIFSNAPDLGGMICITFEERPTNCYSYPHNFHRNNCPLCSKRKPWEVYRDTLAAMAAGMEKAAPDAEFISWLYAPVIRSENGSSAEEIKEELRQIAAHTPKNVIMQMNFESNGKVRQLGREFVAYDYWLAWPGPSGFFADCAVETTSKAGARVSAKIQVGCSHENATIPFMPVPGSLYRKYQSMKELGVSSVMQCWYFGNYPGLMNKAAGELSFMPFPDNENEFLVKLAKIDWAGNHNKIAKAWKYFMKGYSNFPIALSFTWFGPLHCSIVWPLHLFPVDQPIAPSWEFGYPDSGDRIGECVCFEHSLDDILTLLGRMDGAWRKGVELLSGIEKDYEGNSARRLDIGLCKAIGIQIRSAKNVFEFYELREKLPFMRRPEQANAIAGMEGLVTEEIANCCEMKELCVMDPRLGFHSEAEGYKFFPAKLDWRAGMLKQLLDVDFPKVRGDIRNGSAIFPEYVGSKPKGKCYYCREYPGEVAVEDFDGYPGSWKAWHEGKTLHFEVKWNSRTDEKEKLRLDIEPRRLWPFIRFEIASDGNMDSYCPGSPEKIKWEGETRKSEDCLISSFTIPFKSIPWFDGKKMLRINIYQTDLRGKHVCGWIKVTPLKPRSLFGTHNSANLGWLLFA